MSANKISFMTSFGIILLTASLPTFADTAPATAPDVSGTYNCKYHDPSSTPTDSTETITLKKNGDTYKVTMTVTDSVVPYAYGIGTFNKNINNAFAYIYWLPKTPATTNVEFFMIKPDGSLDGVFAQSNKTKAGTETCTKSSS